MRKNVDIIKTSIASSQAELAVREWPAGGTSILALHPGVGDSRIWKWCAPAWAEAGHRVVAYDRRGFGETTYVAEDHDDLDDLRAVASATNSQPAVIVGNSMGGGLALDLALEQPDDVLGLVLIASSPSGFPYDTWPTSKAEAEQDELVAAADEAGDVELTNRLEVRYWLDGTEQPEGRVQGAPRQLMVDMNGTALRAKPVGQASERTPAWPRLGEVHVPVLVIAGEHDLPGVAQSCTQLAELLPDARLATVSGTAHCPSLDQPEALNQLVLDFVRSVVEDA